MADMMDAIKGRRSIRKYEDKPVSPEDLSQVLEAVRWAPSWANCQCWEVVVVSDKTIKEKLQGTLPPKGNPAFKAMVQASIVLALCAKKGVSGFYKDVSTTKFGDWLMYDLGLATQNLCLAAHDLGLGTVIIGAFDHEKAGRAINLPEGYEVVTMIPMGYPAKIGSAPKRRSVDEFVHDNAF